MWIFLQHPCNPSRIYFQHFQALRCSWSGICPHWTRQSLVVNHCMKETGKLIRIYHTPWFSPLVHPNIFFHRKNFLKMFFHIASATFMFPQSFTKWHMFFRGTSRDFQQKIALFTQQTQGCSLKRHCFKAVKQAGILEVPCFAYVYMSQSCHIIWILQLSISRASATSEVAIPSFTPGEASDAYQNRDHSAALILEVAPGGTNRSQHGMAPGSLIAESVWVSASCCWWTYSLLSWFSRNSAIYSNVL